MVFKKTLYLAIDIFLIHRHSFNKTRAVMNYVSITCAKMAYTSLVFALVSPFGAKD